MGFLISITILPAIPILGLRLIEHTNVINNIVTESCYELSIIHAG